MWGTQIVEHESKVLDVIDTDEGKEAYFKETER